MSANERKYRKVASCGFCQHYGRVFTNYRDDICFNCPVNVIKDSLKALEYAMLWEQNHKYCSDNDEDVRNCAHCKYVVVEERHIASQTAEQVSCTLDCETVGNDGNFPMRPHFLHAIDGNVLWI